MLVEGLDAGVDLPHGYAGARKVSIGLPQSIRDEGCCVVCVEEVPSRVESEQGEKCKGDDGGWRGHWSMVVAN